MSDRGDGNKATDLRARIDKRVNEALEAEYARERRHPGRRPVRLYWTRGSTRLS